MRSIPVGSTVHNVEMKPGKGGQLARSCWYLTGSICRPLVMVLMSPCVCVLVKCVK
ncbi:hypothetical protein ACLB1M_26310 [Escherichia coli]